MMARPFIPRPYQKLLIQHIIDHPRCALWCGMGMGKTSSTLFALSYLNAVLDITPALVLAPLRVAQSTWPDEVKKWAELSNLRVSPIIGSAEQRRAALHTPADIYTMNYENIVWLLHELKDTMGKWPFKIIVADESTRLKSYRTRSGGVRAQALAAVAFHAERFVELTGTPAPNGLMDLWGQAWFLDKGERLTKSFSRFQNRWFRPIKVGSDAFAVKWVPCEWSQDEIQKKMADLCLTVKAEDYFPLKDPIVTNVYVDLPPKAKKVYDELQREMFTELEGVEIEAFSAATKTMKCLQAASGAIYDADGEWHELHDAKIEALKSIVEEAAGAPILVAYHWKPDAERLLRAFPQARLLDKSPNTIQEWNQGRIPLLLAHPQSAGHGLNLQDGGNILVFFSHWWDLEQRMQITERIGPTRQHQAGHDRPVFIYNIVAKGTADEVVMARVETKKSIQELLLDAMKGERK